MKIKQDPIYTENSECQDCYKCVRECPVKAIKIKDNKAHIISDLCILCGHCVEVCPIGAKKVRNDLAVAANILRNRGNNKVVVSLAPSYTSEFPDIPYNKIVAAIKMLGFDEVSETALGAEKVSNWVSDKIDATKSEKGEIFISSACPSIVRLIKKYIPAYGDSITKCYSPLLSHAKIIKKVWGENTKIIFIGPCISKKSEADMHPELIEAALTFEDLSLWLKKAGIELNNIETTEKDRFEPFKAGNASLYPVDGGMIDTLKTSHEKTMFVSVSGVNNVKNALTGLENYSGNKNIFLELMACEGGCINGPKASSRNATIIKRNAVMNNTQTDNFDYNKIKDIAIENETEIRPIVEKEYSYSEIQEALKSIGKFDKLDELNCGGCGYNSCRDFAAALINGKAEKTMCLSYLRKIAQKKANALIKTMPAGVVIVNNHMKIIESNRRFAELLGSDIVLVFNASPGMEGASLDKILPQHKKLFKLVLETGADILNKDLRYQNKVLQVSIFSVEKNQIVGAVFQDVTKPVVQKERVVNKAKQVIDKSLSTVQQIAYLLGENAAETEILLKSIIESFNPDEISEGDKEN